MYKEFKPSPQLQSIIKYFFILNFRDKNKFRGRELVSPDGCFDLNFCLGGSKERTDTYFVSLFTKPSYHNPLDMGKIFGITFQPWAVHSMLKIKATEVIDKKIDGLSLFGNSLNCLYQQVLNENNIESAIKITEKYFMDLGISTDKVVRDVSTNIIDSGGTVKLESLYRQYGMSSRSIQQKFINNFGITPKKFSRLIKFRRSLMLFNNHPEDSNLTKLAYDCSYFDQSHFIKEFRSFNGISPSEYIRTNHTIDTLNSNSLFH